jgi:hypothetical protein
MIPMASKKVETTTEAASSAGTTSIALMPLRTVKIRITLIGESPLIVHRWSEKAKKQMLDKQMGKAQEKKPFKNPEQDFRDSLYVLPDGRYGFPIIAFKSAAVTACTSIGDIKKIAARQAFHVMGEYAVIHGDEPTMREDMVRVGMGTADIRYRGEFRNWWTKIDVEANANMLSAEQILNLFRTAGFAVGVGEWRPEKNGQNGRFRVAESDDLRALGLIGEAA